MAKPKSSAVHDQIVRSLADRLRGPHRQVFSEHYYKNKGDHEVDVMMLDFHRKYAYAIEVKTTNHKKARKKAYSQLEADEAYINRRWNINRVFKFYAFRSNHKQRKRGKEYCIYRVR